MKAYELQDERYAESTRATACAEFLAFCRAVLWMRATFKEQDVYGELVLDVSESAVQQSVDMAMGLRAGLQTKARHVRVSEDAF
ncbi:MAG: hypothetical protein AAGK05_17410 [Pseudomonadota bacterium]